MSRRSLTFDLMRSVAIIIVLLIHLPEYCFNFYDLNHFGIPLNLSRLNELNPYLGVGLFVFISGYFIDHSKTSFKSIESIKLFLYKKYLRIFPLYYLALIIFIFIYRKFNFLGLIVHIFGLQLIFTSSDFRPYPTLWFIGAISVYCSLFIIFKVGANNNKILLQVMSYLLCLGFPVAIAFFAKILNITDLRLAVYYGIFWLGLLCHRIKILEFCSQRGLWILFPILSIWYGLKPTHFDLDSNSFMSFSIALILINIMIACFVLLVYTIGNLINVEASATIMKKNISFISYSSYCIYLFHRPVWFFLKTISETILNINSDYILGIIATSIGIPMILLLSQKIQNIYDDLLLGSRSIATSKKS